MFQVFVERKKNAMKKLGILGAMLAFCIALGFTGLPDVGAHLAARHTQEAHKSVANTTHPHVAASRAHEVHKSAANAAHPHTASSRAHAVHKSVAHTTRIHTVSNRAHVVHKNGANAVQAHLVSSNAYVAHKSVAHSNRVLARASHSNLKLTGHACNESCHHKKSCHDKKH
ncbi:MAG TPA: hypothetical protein VGN34_06995, partial [Ktedonobacteraceae bacterium]